MINEPVQGRTQYTKTGGEGPDITGDMKLAARLVTTGLAATTEAIDRKRQDGADKASISREEKETQRQLELLKQKEIEGKKLLQEANNAEQKRKNQIEGLSKGEEWQKAMAALKQWDKNAGWLVKRIGFIGKGTAMYNERYEMLKKIRSLANKKLNDITGNQVTAGGGNNSKYKRKYSKKIKRKSKRKSKRKYSKKIKRKSFYN